MANDGVRRRTEGTPAAVTLATVLLIVALGLGVIVEFVRAGAHAGGLGQVFAFYVPYGWVISIALPVWFIASVTVGARWARIALLIIVLLQLAGALSGCGSLRADGSLAVLLEFLHHSAAVCAVALLFWGRGARGWFRPLDLSSRPPAGDQAAAGEEHPGTIELRRLQALDSLARARAVEALGAREENAEEVVGALIAASLTDRDDDVRRAASRALLAPCHQRYLQEHPVMAARTALRVGRATFGQRFAAFAIDVCVVGALAAMASAWVGGERTPFGVATAVTLGAYALLVLYFVWPYSSEGQTLGKAMLSIRVISVDGLSLSWSKGTIRSIGYVISCVPLCLGFLWSLWDRDRQAWHDKLAGTTVVRASLARERVVGVVSPSVAAAHQRRWLRALGMPALLLGVVAGAALVSYVRGETEKMGPWPSYGVAAREVVPRDLSRLGLTLAEKRDARDGGRWAGGRYEEGVMVTYVMGADTVAAVWALKYRETAVATADFNSSEYWLSRAATEGRSLAFSREASFRFLRTGFRLIETRFIAEKTYLHSHWIVAIWATAGTGATPGTLTTMIRDAIATQWRASLAVRAGG